jgi:Holliday junction resolvase RusA-like endonuclease
MPKPPSVNGLFTNVPGKGRVKTTRYLTWIRAAINEVRSQKVGPVSGPVYVDITVSKRRSNADIDNLIKAPLDLLVSEGLIDDDRHVERVSCAWGDIEQGCQVEIWSEQDRGQERIEGRQKRWRLGSYYEKRFYQNG